MRTNVVKAKLRANEAVFGAIIGSPALDEIDVLAYCGFDFVLIDGEHGNLDAYLCELMVRSCEAVGIVPLGRVRTNNPSEVLQFMETGLMGVVAPQINTRADAERLVQAVKYHPEGKRGMAGSRNSGYGLRQPLSEFAAEWNRETLVMALVEDMEGVRNIGEIAAVPGLDVVIVGLSDLSQSLGLPGLTTHERVVAAADMAIAAALKAGKAVGVPVPTSETVASYYAKGVRYFNLSSRALLANGARQFLQGSRAGITVGG